MIKYSTIEKEGIEITIEQFCETLQPDSNNWILEKLVW